MKAFLVRCAGRALSRIRLRSGESAYDRLRILGPKRTLQYWFAQRILRVNSHVPWPMHWASTAIRPDRIRRAEKRNYLGTLPGAYLQAQNGIEIGRNFRMGPDVKLVSANHDPADYLKSEPAPPIIIGDNVWIGANTVVLPGVRLGNHVIVGAGSVVTRSFPEDDLLIAGVPAEKIRSLPPYEGPGHRWTTWETGRPADGPRGSVSPTR